MLMMYLDPVPPYLERLLSKLEVKPEEKRVSSPYYGYYGGNVHWWLHADAYVSKVAADTDDLIIATSTTNCSAVSARPLEDRFHSWALTL